MEKPVSIYVLEDPADGVAFYVGKTESDLLTRLRGHICDGLAGRHAAATEIQRIVKTGARPIIREIELIPAGEDWIGAEIRWIGLYQTIGRIKNRSTGGGGASGVLRTTEWLSKIVASRRASGKGAEGAKRAAEKNRGRIQSVEERQRRSIAQTGRKHTAEAKAKISRSHMGMSHPPDVIERIAAKKRGKPLSPGHRAKIGANSRDRSDIISAQQIARWQDPEYRERVLTTRRINAAKKREPVETVD